MTDPAAGVERIDDQADNVNAARNFGMGGVIFRDPRQYRNELIEQGVRL